MVDEVVFKISSKLTYLLRRKLTFSGRVTALRAADDSFGPRNTLSITSGRFRFSDHALRARVRGSGEKVKRWQTRTKAEQGPSRRRGRELIVRDKSERVGVPSKRCNCYDY